MNETQIIETTAVVENVKPEGFLTKAMGMFKKHGKKIAVAAAIGAVGLAIYKRGRNSAAEETDDYCDIDDENDFVDVE